MRGLSQAVKVGILVTVMVVGSYIVWQAVGSRPAGSEGYDLWAHFRDASGLPVGSRVMIAGLPIGQIEELSVDGRYARISLRVRSGIKVWSNAVVLKKASSLLGDYYLEIDPGAGDARDAAGNPIPTHLLGPECIRTNPEQREACTEIVHVVEATSPDQLMRRIEESMPKVDAVLVSVQRLTEDVRAIVNGPIASLTNRLDRLMNEEAENIHAILVEIRQIASDVRQVTGPLDERVDRILDRVDSITAKLDDASGEAKTAIASARSEIEQTGAKVREKLDLVDEVLDRSASVMGKVDDPDKGTLGRLVGDTTLADNLEEITGDAANFVHTLFGMQTFVGLRSEYNWGSQLLRHYITVELRTRPDKFYYIELEKGPRGDYPEVDLIFDQGSGQYTRTVRIRDKIRFTFQFAKQFDWLTLRYGLKESTGGIGADADWFDGRLRLSVDLFDATWDRYPRLKLTAAYQVFAHLYVLGGIDEALNSPAYLPILAHPLEVPVQFEEFRYGRDYFLGAMVRFNDLDLAAILTVAGSALGAAAE